MQKTLALLSLLALIVLLGCQSSLMARTAGSSMPIAPDPEKGTVIFLRPPTVIAGHQSMVCRYDNEPEFIGIVSSGDKVAHQVEPGEHTFMIMGGNADFLKLNIMAGAVHYVLVEKRFGGIQTRFVLSEVTKDAMGSFLLKEDMDQCSFVENTPASLDWFVKHKTEIIETHQKYYPQWVNGTLKKETQATLMKSRMVPTNYAAPECKLASDKATIIFMRALAFGGYKEATIYLVNDTPKFIGIVSMLTKVPFQVSPGKHTFMVMGSNTDFMEAEVLPGQAYYVVIKQNFGSFSLEPATAGQRETMQFKDEYSKCLLMTNGPDSLNWFATNKAEITKRYNSQYPKWKQKPAGDKNRLEKTDGRPIP